ncbi:MAG: ABC transporter ATP-binding protein [Kiloniellales bacterium]|nr:ABC transporter ATP-binding protein [Kiloniellales bacterium]MDJ0981298.1 ABC transporter ATP-binding protein [Kiloniellales bacterium]
MYRFFEDLLDPLAPAPVEAPPRGTAAFFGYFLGPIKWLLIATLLVSALYSLCELALFWFVGLVIDWMQATAPERFLEEHGLALAGMALVVGIVRPAMMLLARALVTFSITPSLGNRVRWRSHRYVLRQSLSFFQNDFAGRVAQKVMQTGPAVREATLSVIDAVWYLVILVAGTAALFGGLDWRLFAVIAVWTLGYAAVIVFLVPPVKTRSATLSEDQSALTGRIVDSYTNIQAVKLFAHAAREDHFARDGVARHTRSFQELMRTVFTLTWTLTALNTALIVSVGALSILLWLEGLASPGSVAVAMGLSLRINQMSGWILRMIASLFEQVGTVQNGVETIAQPYSVVDHAQARPLEVHRGAVQFDHVRFRYGAEERQVIEDLSLSIAPGEKVGFVGPSGAGKTTLVNLLLRFHDLEAGRILIDGQDVAAVTQESLRAAIGMVTQDTSLLHRSIRDNIRYGRPEASEDEILRAATLAEADRFIPELTDPQGRSGLDAYVGERGVKLSGGQRQRIAIARVILKDAPILVLDEATSALDSEVEAAIQSQLGHLMQGKTVIAIAHRLSTIAALDRLVVLDQGRIVEEGSHAELLERGGLYARLWARQSGGFLGVDQKLSA